MVLIELIIGSALLQRSSQYLPPLTASVGGGGGGGGLSYFYPFPFGLQSDHTAAYVPAYHARGIYTIIRPPTGGTGGGSTGPTQQEAERQARGKQSNRSTGAARDLDKMEYVEGVDSAYRAFIRRSRKYLPYPHRTEDKERIDNRRTFPFFLSCTCVFTGVVYEERFYSHISIYLSIYLRYLSLPRFTLLCSPRVHPNPPHPSARHNSKFQIHYHQRPSHTYGPVLYYTICPAPSAPSAPPPPPLWGCIHAIASVPTYASFIPNQTKPNQPTTLQRKRPISTSTV